jgi:hypothetical protein
MRTSVLLAALAAALLLPVAGDAAPAPETTITAGPAPVMNTATASFTFTSSDPKARFACSLDAGAFASCTTPYTVTVADGAHHLVVTAVVRDAADPTPAEWSWTVDTTPPAPVRPRVSVSYGRLTLGWGNLAALGADTVALFRSTSRKQPASVQIYRGGAVYVDKRFQNRDYHRYRAITVDAAGNASQPVDFVVAPDALLISPKDGATLRAPLHLRWRAAPKATFYNAQLFRAGRKILSAWPRTTSMTVPRSWTYNGHRYRLRPGRYTWFVWPGFGRLVLGRYGQLLGRDSFSVR